MLGPAYLPPRRCSNSTLRHKTLSPLGRLLMRVRGSVATLASTKHRQPPEAQEGEWVSQPAVGRKAEEWRGNS